MKTKEELKKLSAECETLAKKLNELTDDELKEVTGGYDFVALLGPGGAGKTTFLKMIPGLEDISGSELKNWLLFNGKTTI